MIRPVQALAKASVFHYYDDLPSDVKRKQSVPVFDKREKYSTVSRGYYLSD